MVAVNVTPTKTAHARESINSKNIIFVPGKNPKPAPEQHRQLLWRCMIEGIRRSELELVNDLPVHPDCFRLIAWNYLYYHQMVDISRDLPWIDALINKHGPTTEGVLDTKSLQRSLAKILFSAGDRFPFIIPLPPKTIRGIAHETRHLIDYPGEPVNSHIWQTVAETLDAFSVKPQGLTQAEADKRLEQYGYNEIEEKEELLWHRLFRRFWGPIPWMIEIAAVLSALVQKWEDFVIILVMLLVNAGLDFFQEHRALNALKTLKAGMAREVRVLREGVFRQIPARELVPPFRLHCPQCCR